MQSFLRLSGWLLLSGLGLADPVLGKNLSTPAASCFVTGGTLATGPFPRSITTADFNGDGNADLAVANLSSDSVSVFLGDGAGGFGPGATFPVGSGPQSITTADFNEDGRADLAVATGGELGLASPFDVSILLGNGAGGFAPPRNFGIGDPGSHSLSVAVADFNRDGHADLALGNYGLSRVSIFLGDGKGSFTLSGTFGPLFQNVFSVAVGDFNGDGNPDVAATSDFINAVYVLLGNGKGLLGPPTAFRAGPLAIGVTVGDLNGDGSQDLVVANEGGSVVSVLVGFGDGNFVPAVNYPVGLGSRGVVLTDLNIDGAPDIVVANEVSDDVSVLFGNGTGGFGPTASVPVGLDPISLAAADFNHDGLPDLAVVNGGSNSVSVLINAAPTVLPVSLPAGTVNTNYPPMAFSASGGAPPYTFARSGNSQLAFDPATATIYGIFGSATPVIFSIAVTDANGCSSTRSYSLTVNRVDTPVRLTSSVNSAQPGQVIRLTATLEFSPTGPATPTGVVYFHDALNLIGTAPVVVNFDSVRGVLNGGATIDISTLSPGRHLLTAAYSGDGNFNSSTSPILTLVVGAPEIPTLGPVALAALALLLAGATLFLIRTRA
ncbi:MAG: hypothetical protein DMF55_06025 [Acidobacteria bacterium]|nr:MAG: hypothetical protein DMF55_06025 [Acidobacteriota bacterium]